MMNSRATFAVLAVIVSGCGTPPPIQVGSTAPDFRAYSLESGDTITFSGAYAGEVTLVNVWATWCEPCKEEIPALDTLHRTLSDRGFRVVAVSIDTRDTDVVRNFIEEFDVAFDVLHDQSGDIQQLYQTRAVPESFLIGRDGRIVRIVYGDHPWASSGNRRIIEQLLDAPAGSEESS